MQLKKIGMCEVMKVKAMEDGFNTRMTNQIWRRNGIVSQHEIWKNAEIIVYQHGRFVTTNINMYKKTFLCNNKMLVCINEMFLCNDKNIVVYQHGHCVTTSLWRSTPSNCLSKHVFWKVLWFMKITLAWNMSVLFLQSILKLILQWNLLEKCKMYNARLSTNANKFK